jgi:hypothetical protein
MGPHYMESEMLLPYSQDFITNPYVEPDESTRSHNISYSFLMFCFNLRLGIPNGLFLSGVQTEALYVFLNSLIFAKRLSFV